MKYFIYSLFGHLIAAATIAYSGSHFVENRWSDVTVIAIESDEKLSDKNFHLPSGALKTKISKKNQTNLTKAATLAEDSASKENTENRAGPQQNGLQTESQGPTNLNAVGKGVTNPLDELISTIHKNKVYPYEAVRLKQQGLVRVSFRVDADGYIQQVTLVLPCEHKLLNRAAVQTIERIRHLRHISKFESLVNRDFTFTFEYELTQTADAYDMRANKGKL